MSLPVTNIRARIVSPAYTNTSKRGEYASLIIDVGTKVQDHWYANVYPEGDGEKFEFGDLQPVVEAQQGDYIVFSGRVRRWTRNSEYTKGTGVTIDIFEASVEGYPLWVDEDEEETERLVQPRISLEPDVNL